MDDRTIAALIASITAIVIAFWSLATSRLSRSLALKAEETAKRGELVRVKALEAIDTVLDALWDLMQMVAFFTGSVKYKGGVNTQDPAVMRELETYTTRMTALARLRFKACAYLTPEIDAQIDDVLKIMGMLKFNSDDLEQIRSRLQVIAKSLCEISRKQYLS